MSMASPQSEQLASLDTLPSQLMQWTRPRHLPELVSHWPVVQAAKKSDAALVNYLQHFDKNVAVDCLELPHAEDGRMFYNADMSGFNFTRSRKPFMQALSTMLALAEEQQPDSLYVGSTTVQSCLPGFVEENPIGLDTLDPLATLWIGNKSRIAAHYDVPDNLICVTAGKRKVTLFPPEQVENLYVGPLHFTPAGQAISLVDFKNPDFDRFPKFATALENALVVELHPGDALYIPSMWWHHIEGQETMNMLVNFWWRETPAHLGRTENALYHALLALNSLPDSQREAWKAMFNHYVFGESANRFSHIPEHRQGPLGQIDEPTTRQFKAWLANNLKQ